MNHKKLHVESKILLITILLLCIFNLPGYTQQFVCPDFTITGTSYSPYYLSQDPSCTITPLPAGSVLWNQQLTGIINGFVKHTFNSPQTNVSIWYTFVNVNDTGRINVNGAGIISLSVASGCTNLSGNILGPYTGSGNWGDVLVNIQSTLPFTEVTLINITNNTGIGSGDCNSVSTNLCNIQLGNDTNLCQGDTLVLNATTPNATYLWQDGSTNPTFNVTQQGTYWLQLTSNNCSSPDTINVNYNQFPIINLDNDTTLCQGETVVLNATTPNATYLWQDNSTSPTYNVTQQGTYWVEVTVNNCSSPDTINVNYNQSPINLDNEITLCQDDTLVLNATTPSATYLWQDGSTNPTFNVTQQGTYWIEVTVNNCTTTNIILISEKTCEITLEIPNVFTPNKDGNNDLFIPIKRKGIISINTKIYNRWGQLVFTSDLLEIGWDGRTSAGLPVPDGTYFWTVHYTDINGKEDDLSGYLTIFK
ncbi:MAG: hypothetical protein COB15_03460 [Flavobacteriales bacterium]|nr:MAG: hypothetical protein COB15_03460 [Flavobacteriales bacterium]